DRKLAGRHSLLQGQRLKPLDDAQIALQALAVEVAVLRARAAIVCRELLPGAVLARQEALAEAAVGQEGKSGCQRPARGRLVGTLEQAVLQRSADQSGIAGRKSLLQFQVGDPVPADLPFFAQALKPLEQRSQGRDAVPVVHLE